MKVSQFMQLIGMDGCQDLINNMLQECKQKAGLPQDLCLKALVNYWNKLVFPLFTFEMY